MMPIKAEFNTSKGQRNIDKYSITLRIILHDIILKSELKL